MVRSTPHINGKGLEKENKNRQMQFGLERLALAMLDVK
jgi:hypothetical protein